MTGRKVVDVDAATLDAFVSGRSTSPGAVTPVFGELVQGGLVEAAFGRLVSEVLWPGLWRT